MYFMAVKSRENVPFCDVFIKVFRKTVLLSAIKRDAKSKLGQYKRAVSFFNRRCTFFVKWTPKTGI